MAQEVIASPDFADTRFVYISSKADEIQMFFVKLIDFLGPGHVTDGLTYS
eukprot:CAMPEP_0168503172 /NCGR_PEP_ID=MMETSP0228-20121227/75710_1 /TAXON_ID=133427 /ORGANISM="Protoceratium reticulatum, Strain CCCM 535 (=CCMP 1889)" /LENGTH=49 /DNA_ID= /DNA_START= /DNA_END= /DNA_ORIENTATION=